MEVTSVETPALFSQEDPVSKLYLIKTKNLAEPIDEIQQSYEKFLRRMERHKNQRIQRLAKTTNRHMSARNVLPNDSETEENNQMPPHEKDRKTKQATAERGSDKPKMFSGDDTVVVKFVDTAFVGKSEAEDACHHGLVDPTINMKEAMTAINSMFSEPLETVPVGKSCQRRPKNNGNPDNGFQVFVDDNLDKGIKLADQKEEKSSRIENQQLHQEPFSIYVDNEENDKVEHENLAEDNFDRSNFCNSREDHRSASHANAFVFPSPNDLPSESSDDMDIEGSHRPRFREDTVVCRFVGSAILDEPEVENVCHHGLVDPTINLKEAMDDINNMFGQPIDFVRTRRSKKLEKAPTTQNDFGGFTILADEDLEHEPVKPMPKSSGKSRDWDLFEPTLVTKEAFDDINKMFGMPLDF
ncbi:Mitotic spindle checkpoint protein Bub1/Mad [Parasponia andersonii]|uniref:Mitotic spindle checkpoint protein Bub1/Mad n=1 Tax=Parasponia andersonii TaxID=3476 RepID=A0A2P5BRG0_PARAD|nr:Mitotic spindle checkpoint protein Bub1/Mad [Parasponia andersonii]